MPAPSPVSATVGQKLTAPFWNTEVAAALIFLANPPACSLRHSTTQSLTTATFTALLFDTEDFDTDSGHSTITNTSRYTVVTAGKYAIEGLYAAAANATGSRSVRIAVNGTAVTGSQVDVPSVGAAANTSVTTSALVQLNAGDYVEVQGWQNSGGGLATVAGSSSACRFNIRWVSK